MTPSIYQQAVYDFVNNGTGSALIEATAGSGKTTTILNALNFIPRTQSVLFLAFNKNIAAELSTRVPAGVNAATFHSVGFRAYMGFMGRVKVAVAANKVSKILSDNLTSQENDFYYSFALKLVGLAKNSGMGYPGLMENTFENWEGLVEHFDVQLQNEEADINRGIEIARAALAESVKDRRSIDFDDMLYMPLILNASFQRYDWVFIDEVQDTNGVQRHLLKRMIKPVTGRLIAVGDKSQAIYGFRGADADAVELLANEFKCTRMPLSISYRCAKKVVVAAQEYCAQILPSDTAPDGKVESLEKYSPVDFTKNDAILCRNTAPLITMAYSFMARGIGCRMLGREIGEGLINLIKKMKAKTIEELSTRLDTWYERETEAIRKKSSDKVDERKLQAIEDKRNCIAIFIENLPETNRTVMGLTQSISNLFADKEGVITLATAHKSKGLEWKRVFILDRFLMPSKYARQDWQIQQEKNITYVAFTRAKEELYFIDSGNWTESLASVTKPSSASVTEAPKKVAAKTGEVSIKLFPKK